MSSNFYSIRINLNGQPDILVDSIALYNAAKSHADGHCYIHNGNDGERRVSMAGDIAGFVEVCKAAGARTRKVKGGVKVMPSRQMLEKVAALDSMWQDLAREHGGDHLTIRNAMINA